MPDCRIAGLPDCRIALRASSWWWRLRRPVSRPEPSASAARRLAAALLALPLLGLAAPVAAQTIDSTEITEGETKTFTVSGIPLSWTGSSVRLQISNLSAFTSDCALAALPGAGGFPNWDVCDNALAESYNPNTRILTFELRARADSVNDPDETFTITLRDPDNDSLRVTFTITIKEAQVTPVTPTTKATRFLSLSLDRGKDTCSVGGGSSKTYTCVKETDSAPKNVEFQVKTDQISSSALPFRLCFSGSATRRTGGNSEQDDYLIQERVGSTWQTRNSSCVDSSIAANQQLKRFRVQVLGDNHHEQVPMWVNGQQRLVISGQETVNITLNPSPGNPLPSPYGIDSVFSIKTLVIDDDDYHQQPLAFGTWAGQPGVKEGRPSADQNVGIPFSAQAGWDNTVTYRVVPGNEDGGSTATYGADYRLRGGYNRNTNRGTMTLAKGKTLATLPITVIEDELIEGTETVVLEMVSMGTYSVGSPNRITVHIQDDEAKPLLKVDESGTVLRDGVDSGHRIKIALAPAHTSIPDRSLSVDAHFEYCVEGSATLGDDYTLARPDGTKATVTGCHLATLPKGQLSTYLDLTLFDDGSSDEPDESVKIRLQKSTVSGKETTDLLKIPDSTRIANETISTVITIKDDLPVLELSGYDDTDANDRIRRYRAKFTIRSVNGGLTDGLYVKWQVEDTGGVVDGNRKQGLGKSGYKTLNRGFSEFTVPISLHHDAGAGSVTFHLMSAGRPFRLASDSYCVRINNGLCPVGNNAEVIQAPDAQSAPAQQDEAQAAPIETPVCVSDALLADAQLATTETWRTSPGHVERWSRVLAAFGESNGYSPMTIAEAQAQADRGLKRWAPVAPALECLANPPQEEQPKAQEEKTITPPAVPELSLSSGSAVEEGSPASFTVTADSAVQSDLTIAYTVSQNGDYLDAPGSGQRTVTLAAGATTVSLLIDTVDDALDEADGSVTVTVDTRTGYTIATNKDTASIPVRDNDEPVVRITPGSGVTEGDAASFTVSADPLPAAPLDITVTVAQSGEFADSGETGARTLTLPVTGSATFTVATLDDSVDEPDGSVTATIDTGTGYLVAAPPDDSALVAVSDNDAAASGPTLSIADATMKENQRNGYFKVTLSEKVAWPVHVYYATRDSTPVSAVAGQDYLAWRRSWQLRARFQPGQTETQIHVPLYNDSHDEDPETFEMVLFDAGVNGPPGVSVSIADGVAVGTITNSDPMPAAWLSRFGRTIAQQAIDGLSNRMADRRAAGMQGTVAGQAFTLGSGPSESVRSHASAYSFDYDSAHSTEQVHDRHHFGGTQSQSYDMTVREALLNSSFTATSEKDAQGGSVSFWGRATQGHFDGREGAFSLDGETTTALLGTDYAKDNWLVGLTLIQSDGDGSYTDTDTSNRVPEQMCNQENLPAQARQVLCNGAVREGDGKVEASLTAITPYTSMQVSDSIQLWGTLGQGSGEVTLQPELGDAISSDISWSMAAMGMRGDLLPARESGLSLALTADALWSRTESDKTHALAASDASTTRIRAGLESSWKKNLENGQLTPRLEVGIRQDGGDAETGTGLEIGGGIAWNDTTLGLSLDLSGRTLVSHDSDDLEDRGYGASFVFDPQPDSQRGLSLTIGQDWGGQSTGGLDALFAEQSISERTGSASESRWHAQAAYGFSMLSGRFTGSPYLDMGITDSTQEYTLGWRLQPVYTTGKALNFTLDIQATHRETDDNEPTQFVGVEVGVRW